MQDGVLEGLWIDPGVRAGEVWFFRDLGGMGRKVAFGGAHLKDPPCHELPRTHERVRWSAGGVIVVGGGQRQYLSL